MRTITLSPTLSLPAATTSRFTVMSPCVRSICVAGRVYEAYTAPQDTPCEDFFTCNCFPVGADISVFTYPKKEVEADSSSGFPSILNSEGSPICRLPVLPCRKAWMALTVFTGVVHCWVRFSCSSQRCISCRVRVSAGVRAAMASMAAVWVGMR